jgi:hypothetical protein
MAAMFINGSGKKLAIFREELPWMLPTKFHFISEEKIKM